MTDVRIGELATMLGLSVSRVRQLVDAGLIPHRLTPGGHRVFDLAEIAGVRAMARIADSGRLGAPAFSASYALEGLAEHEVWWDVRRSVEFRAGSDVVHLVEYALEEMVNNAISHSGGSVVRVSVWSTSEWLAFSVSDDGIGALARLKSELGLPDALSAIQELSKGKRTTFPEEHTGQGIFFTSKAMDRFVLLANGWQWTVDTLLEDQTVEQAPESAGTVVAGIVSAASTRVLGDVFAAFTIDGEFARSRPSVKLVTYGTRLVSRSEAKLILEGLDQFREVDLDFRGVDAVGQGFVDEVFRVWAGRHPDVRLVPINMNEAVRFMVERGLPGALR